jgi:hypothetical protein
MRVYRFPRQRRNPDNSAQKYKGIRLGIGQLGRTGPIRYRVRHGRELSYNTVAGLSREWLQAYVAWVPFARSGAARHALQRDWLEAGRS